MIDGHRPNLTCEQESIWHWLQWRLFSWFFFYFFFPIFFMNCNLWSIYLLQIFVDFQDQEVDEELELLVLASDGLWDVVPNEVDFSPSLSLSVSLTHTHPRMCTTILAIITFFSTHQEERALSILRLIHWIDLRLEHLIKRMGLHVPLILQYPLLHACHTC